MTTQTQDTHPQDPIDRFTLRIEGLRRMPVPRGVAGIVHRLFVEFFIGLWTALAIFAEQRRNGTLAKVVPVEAPVPGPSRAWPEGLKPRESGWVEQRNGGTMLEQIEQPEMAPAVEEPIGGARSETPPCEVAGVEKRVTANVYRWLPLTPALICFAAQALKGRGRSDLNSKNGVEWPVHFCVHNVTS